MSFVTAIGRGAQSRRSPVEELSPNDFAADLDKLATQLLGNQLYALVGLRQPQLRILSDPTGLGRVTLTTQARNQRAARHFLGTIQPRMTQLVSDATALGALMQELNRTLARTDDRQTAAEALSRVVDRMRDYEAGARDGLALVRTNADITDNSASMLGKAIDKVIAALADRDARIARARANVEKSERTVSEAVQAVLGECDVTRPGLRDIATAAVALRGGIAGASPRRCGAIAQFHVETVTTIAQDMPGRAAAPQAIRDGNAVLQGHYGMLATCSTMLAAAQAIRGQAAELAEAACRLARIAGETDATLTTLIASIDALRLRLGAGEAVAVIAAELDAAMFAWTRLTIRTRETERILSAMNLLFPEA